MSTPRVVLLVVVVAVLVRLPFLAAQPSPDEAGLLLVGGQWGPGDSLYGDFWVDRPPVLIGLAGLVAHAGGVIALRVLGLVAVAATVVACAAAAGRLAGERAARFAAAAAAVLTVSPWLGADRVNAELLAAPWIALAVLAAVRAVEQPRRLWSVLAGAAGAAAMLTKQNQADAAVFVLVLLVTSVLGSRLRAPEALRVAAGSLIGGLGLTTVVLLLAWTRGTDPLALLDALYAFRVRAAEVIEAYPGPSVSGRRTELLVRCVIAGQLVLAAAVAAAPLLRPFRSPAAWALSATVLYGCVSIGAGGSWWNHYLIELSVPVAVGTGMIAARTRLVVPIALAYATGAALVGTVLLPPVVNTIDAPIAAGQMVGAAAQRGDTLVNAWGRPDIVLESGLSSPYAHLWSLPVRTDDPDLADFTAVLSGPHAPTWLVTRGSLSTRGVDARRAERVMDQRYRQVGTVCERRIWLLAGEQRPALRRPPAVRCNSATTLR